MKNQSEKVMLDLICLPAYLFRYNVRDKNLSLGTH